MHSRQFRSVKAREPDPNQGVLLAELPDQRRLDKRPMQTTIDIDEALMRELDTRARDAGTSADELAAAFIREGLKKSPAPAAHSDSHRTTSHRNTNLTEPERLPNGLPQLYLESGAQVTLDTLTDLLATVEADDDLGPPLSIDETTRAEIVAYAHEHHIAAGLFAARLLQQSLLYRKEWPSWHGIPQVPWTNREPVTLAFVKQLQEALDLEDALN